MSRSLKLSQGLMPLAPLAGVGKCVLWCVDLDIYLRRGLTLLLASSTIMIEDIYSMRKSGLALLAFFYCDFRDDRKMDRRELLSSLLAQLCYQSDFYSAILSKFHLAHESGSRYPSDDALLQCIIHIL